jgi:hypothetical protein
MNKIERPVNLSYLGPRNYIDVSTLSESFFKACGYDNNDPAIESEAIRIYKKISHHGILTTQHCISMSCKFEYSVNNEKRTYYFLENGPLITTTHPEILYKHEEHFIIQDKIARFIKPINKTMTYNLMCIGKALILSNSQLTPRVVQTDLRFNLRADDYANLSIEFTPLKNDFILLRTYVNEKKHGDIHVKLLKNPDHE